MKIFTLLILFSSYSLAEIKEFDLTSGKLVVENGSGKVQILGSSQSKVKIEYIKTKWGKNCDLIFERTSDTVYAKVDKKSSWNFLNKCQVDFNITAPKSFSIAIKSGSGDLSVNSMSGDIDFKTGSGNVTGQKLFSSTVTGRSGSGDINLKGTFSKVDIKIGNGNTSTHFEGINKPGNFFAESGSGDISIIVPPNSTVGASFKSGLGQLKNKALYSDTPDLKVDVKTGSGDLRIE